MTHHGDEHVGEDNDDGHVIEGEQKLTHALHCHVMVRVVLKSGKKIKKKKKRKRRKRTEQEEENEKEGSRTKKRK